MDDYTLATLVIFVAVVLTYALKSHFDKMDRERTYKKDNKNQNKDES